LKHKETKKQRDLKQICNLFFSLFFRRYNCDYLILKNKKKKRTLFFFNIFLKSLKIYY